VQRFAFLEPANESQLLLSNFQNTAVAAASISGGDVAESGKVVSTAPDAMSAAL
jgi:hypothetical protein